MKTILFRIFLFFFTAIFFSCRKTTHIARPEDYPPTSFNNVFEAFWSGMNNNYVFWDIDKEKVNWDSMYMKYKPMFAQLDITNYEDILSAVDYVKEMTRNLTDSHLAITFNDSRLGGYVFNPSVYKKMYKDFTGNITDSQLTITNPQIYLDKPFYKTSASGLNILSGTIHKNILYLHFNKFHLKNYYDSSGDNSGALTFFVNYIKKNKKDKLKGLIVDLRNNSGGGVEDLNFLVGMLTEKSLKFGTLRYKFGDNRLDYTAWINATVTPQQSDVGLTAPICVLVNSTSKSMAEISAMALKILPNTKIIGDTTWGATGIIPNNYNNQLYNGGPFVAASFINVYTPAAEFKYIDNKNYEGIGFPPDIYILNSNDGKDEQLEKAISLLGK